MGLFSRVSFVNFRVSDTQQLMTSPSTLNWYTRRYTNFSLCHNSNNNISNKHQRKRRERNQPHNQNLNILAHFSTSQFLLWSFLPTANTQRSILQKSQFQFYWPFFLILWVFDDCRVGIHQTLLSQEKVPVKDLESKVGESHLRKLFLENSEKFGFYPLTFFTHQKDKLTF